MSPSFTWFSQRACPVLASMAKAASLPGEAPNLEKVFWPVDTKMRSNDEE